MNKSSIRIMNDYIDFNKNKPDGIYLWIDKSNIFQQYALIMGPKNTPYFGGYFFFNIKYPENYPATPPAITLITINNMVRFNPNLYENGKVCLSILGTWNGPSWKPIMNIRLVLSSIHSLLGEYPIQNEPGYEKVKPEHISSVEYNIYITYYTYLVAIINTMDNKYPLQYSIFENEIKKEFHNNFNKLEQDLLSYQTIYNKVSIKKQIYFMKDETLDFNIIVNKFNELKSKIFSS